MKNNNVLKDRKLHNFGIDSNFKNFDLLSEFILDEFADKEISSSNFSVIGFDFDSENRVQQLQPMEGYDFLEVFNEAFNNVDVYGKSFCILHHDQHGFHYLVF